MAHLRTKLPSKVAAVAAAPAIQKVLHSVEEAAVALSVGRTTIFDLIRTGQLRAVRIGKRRLVAASELEAYASRLQQGQDPVTIYQPKSCFQPEDDPTRSAWDREAWRDAKDKGDIK